MTRSAKHKAAKPAAAKAAPPSPRQSHVAAVTKAPRADPATGDQYPQDAPLLVLHVIRILALYLYVLLARHPQQDALNLCDVFFPETATVELLVESTASRIEEQVHAALLACVQGEIASNQFDGLIQEKTVFAAIKRIFRQRKTRASAQCQLLLRLLNGYLAQLARAPIVRCGATGTLASTLEYLAPRGDLPPHKSDAVAPSLLYPLVNAVDSLLSEQRDCLDALTLLWRWVEASDPTSMLLDRIIQLHHKAIFFLAPTDPAKPGASATVASRELGARFVRTLVRHADHIFRHDLDFTDPHDLLSSDSETETSDDACSHFAPRDAHAPTTPPSKQVSAAPTFSPATKTKALANVDKPAPTRERADGAKEVAVLDAHEPMPANMMRVGIAAAAGTLAAALCVIFT